MLYANVVVGLPVEGPFDYSIPEDFEHLVKPGCRAWVFFGTRRVVGYVVAVSKKASVAKVKPLSALIDEQPLIDSRMLAVARRQSEFFCCSWGEMIESSLPEALRKGKKIAVTLPSAPAASAVSSAAGTRVLSDPSGDGRWQVYADMINATVAGGRSVIAIFSDKKRAFQAFGRLAAGRSAEAEFVFRKKPHEIEEWQKIKEAAVSVVCGTRSSIFAPVNNLGLIIVDEEQDPVHKQEQVPHYHPREAALIRAKLQGASVVLCSSVPSLEAYQLVLNKKAVWQDCALPSASPGAALSIVDMKNIPVLNKKQGLVIAQTIIDAISASLKQGEKTLLFLNRRGFATYAVCRGCQTVMRCQRCSTALTFHFKENQLRCRYCGYSLAAPSICPACNSGYLYYAGAGTEKAESELARLFPGARIGASDAVTEPDPGAADICIASEAGVRHGSRLFDTVAVLAIDAMLNKVDFRAAERAFALLTRLRTLCKSRMFVQTNLAQDHCFHALVQNDQRIFYHEEYAQRKQLRFPPLRHFIAVKLRGPRQEKVKAAAQSLAETFKMHAAETKIEVVAVMPGQPLRLRGNFQWEVLLSVRDPGAVSPDIKIILKQTKHSGIIVTVDVDPV